MEIEHSAVPAVEQVCDASFAMDEQQLDQQKWVKKYIYIFQLYIILIYSSVLIWLKIL